MSSLTRKAGSPSLLPSRSGRILGVRGLATIFGLAVAIRLVLSRVELLGVLGVVSGVAIPAAWVKTRGTVLGLNVHFFMYPGTGNSRTRPTLVVTLTTVG